ncbi:hypothetical protein N431DRAFT_70678 [Stipitochalara longipes BDJ]|nr:hypothetical protein N431DRAFT_70678 [Stipitochalara longipes BDJ]
MASRWPLSVIGMPWMPTPQQVSASLIGGGRRMRHVHARKGTGSVLVFLRFVQVDACLALPTCCVWSGEQREVSMAGE